MDNLNATPLGSSQGADDYHSKTDSVKQLTVSGYPPVGVKPESIPDELQQLMCAVWIAEPREGQQDKYNKAPRNAKGHRISVNRPEQWMTFSEAVAAYRTGQFSGIGVRVDGSLVGLDIDDVKEAFQAYPGLKALVQRAKTAGIYIEVSPSGNGLRVFVRGTLTHHLTGSQQGGIKVGLMEAYEDARHLTVTGQGEGEIKDAQWLIDEFAGLIHAAKGNTAQGGEKAGNVVAIRREPPAPALSPEDFQQKVEAATAKVAETRSQLWRGDLGGTAGGAYAAGVARVYTDRSEADHTLACEAVRQAHTAGVPEVQLAEAAEAVMRQSGLVRDKWDRSDYLPRTIERAIGATTAERMGGGRSGSNDAEIGDTDRQDVRRAELFTTVNKGKLKLNHTKRKWYAWSGSCWEHHYGAELEAAKRVAEAIMDQATTRFKADPDSRRSKALMKFAKESHTLRAIEAMPRLSSTDPAMHVAQADLDPDTELLCVPNGYIDLRTGGVYDSNPHKLMSRQAGVAYDPEAQCPQWLGFLDAVFAGDQTIADFIQLAVGYSLTGRVDDECMFILYGHGSNGKSVFQNTIMRLMHSYAITSPPSLLVWRANDDGPKNEVAALAGARMASVNELESGDRLHEQIIKRVAGREPITARFLYGEYFEYWPTAKVWLRTNHQPIITGTDDGIWRRLVLVPFTRQFTGAAKDPRLEDKLTGELPGILAWAVQGAIRWFAQGLVLPTSLQRELGGYRTESDVLGEFLRRNTKANPTGRVAHVDLWTHWKLYTHDDGFATGTKHSFTRRLKERGIQTKASNGQKFYVGLELRGPTAHRGGVG